MTEAEASQELEAREPFARPSPAQASQPSLPSLAGSADLVVWTGLAVAAGIAAFALPSGSWLRIALAALIIFVVPGVLLMEALFPPWHATPPARRFRLALALGLSPALVGLIALSLALVPGAFRPANIVALVTLTCVLLGAAGFTRRARIGEPARAALVRLAPRPPTQGRA